MCTLSPSCVIRPNGRWPDLEWDGPAVGKKAASRPSEHRIWVERQFWRSLQKNADSPLTAAQQQLALVCHEKGHDEGAECEECADTRGGQIYRELGLHDDAAAIQMFLTRIQHRSATDAAQAFHAGFANSAGARPADAGRCPGTVDGAGLCKAAVLSFHAAEGVAARRSKARVRGMDAGQCQCIRAAAAKGIDVLPVMSGGVHPSMLDGAVLAMQEGISTADDSDAEWMSSLVYADADTRYPEADRDVDLDSSFARRLMESGAVPPFRATYDPSEFAFQGRPEPIETPIVVDNRGHLVMGPAYLMAMEGCDHPMIGDRLYGADSDITPATLAANLLSNAPTSLAPFKTLNAPSGESLAQILADVAFQYFPDDPYRYAYLMLAIINHEALANTIGSPQDGSYLAGTINWNYTDGSNGNNANSDTPDPTKTVASTDYGLGQINNRWHKTLTDQTYTDPTQPGVEFASWMDARLNVGMLAQVLAASRNDFPGDYLSQLNSYAAGSSAVRKGLAASPPVALINSKGKSPASGSDSGSQELAFLKGLGVDPNDPSMWAGLGSANATDSSGAQSSPDADAALAGIGSSPDTGDDTSDDDSVAQSNARADAANAAQVGMSGGVADSLSHYGDQIASDRKWAIALVAGLVLLIVFIAKRPKRADSDDLAEPVFV